MPREECGGHDAYHAISHDLGHGDGLRTTPWGRGVPTENRVVSLLVQILSCEQRVVSPEKKSGLTFFSFLLYSMSMSQGSYFSGIFGGLDNSLAFTPTPVLARRRVVPETPELTRHSGTFSCESGIQLFRASTQMDSLFDHVPDSLANSVNDSPNLPWHPQELLLRRNLSIDIPPPVPAAAFAPMDYLGKEVTNTSKVICLLFQ